MRLYSEVERVRRMQQLVDGDLRALMSWRGFDGNLNANRSVKAAESVSWQSL